MYNYWIDKRESRQDDITDITDSYWLTWMTAEVSSLQRTLAVLAERQKENDE